jgi:hypothetical protein
MHVHGHRHHPRLQDVQANWRARQRRCEIIIGITINGELIDWLVRLRWLDERQADDKRAIARAIDLLLQDASEADRTPGQLSLCYPRR